MSVACPSLPGVLIRLAKLILVLALVSTIGLHWAFFQSLAWTSMLADNLRRDNLAQAVTHTFDGQHPCQLCKAIADGKKSEKKSEWTTCFKTLEFPPATEDFAVTAPARLALPWRADFFARSLSETPPTPPPRRAYV
jgi:hypothetical protein